MTRRHSGLEAAGLFAIIALLTGCGHEPGGCSPCTDPPDSIAGFPRVHREAGTSRVVAELKVGEVAYLCAFSVGCSCSPPYVQWGSSDSSVATVAASNAPLSVCYGNVEPSSTGGNPEFPAELRGLRQGEMQVVATAAGQRVPNVYCTGGAGVGCLNVDVVRVTE